MFMCYSACIAAFSSSFFKKDWISVIITFVDFVNKASIVDVCCHP